MFARLALIGLSLAVVAGCAAPPPPPPPGLDNPANPGAAEAPVPPTSNTLATDAGTMKPTPPPPDESGGPQKKVKGTMQDMPGMDGMDGTDGTSGMSHGGMAGMGHPAPATMPAGNGAAGGGEQ